MPFIDIMTILGAVASPLVAGVFAVLVARINTRTKTIEAQIKTNHGTESMGAAVDHINEQITRMSTDVKYTRAHVAAVEQYTHDHFSRLEDRVNTMDNRVLHIEHTLTKGTP